MARFMRTRFGLNVEVWLEKNGDSLRLVYKGPNSEKFTMVRNVPARPALPDEQASEGLDRRLYVHGTDPELVQMQRVKT
jgi:hypothetical protein